MSQPPDDSKEDWGGLKWDKEHEQDPDIVTFKKVWKTGRPQKFGWKPLEVLQKIRQIAKMDIDWQGNDMASYLVDHGWDADPADADSLKKAGGYSKNPTDYESSKEDVTEEQRLAKAQEDIDSIYSAIGFIEDENIRNDLYKQFEQFAKAKIDSITKKTRQSKSFKELKEEADAIQRSLERQIEEKTKTIDKQRDELARKERELEDAKIPPPNYIWVRVLDEIPQFMGKDFRLRGPYRSGEEINIPEDDAPPLEKLGKLVRITAGKDAIYDPQKTRIDELQKQISELNAKLREKPKEVTVEKVVEKVVYKEAPRTTPPKPKTEVKEEGIWTKDFLNELLDIYNDYLLTAGVSPRGKIAAFNTLIRELKATPDVSKENARELVRDKARVIAENFPGKVERSQLSKLRGFEPAPPEERGREMKTGGDFGTDEDIEGGAGGGAGFAFKPRASKTRRYGKTPNWPSRLTNEELDLFRPLWTQETFPYGSAAQLEKWFEWETWVSFEAAQDGFNELVEKVANDKDVVPLWVDEFGKEHYVSRHLISTNVGELIGGTWFPDTPVDEQIIQRLRIMVLDKKQKPFKVKDIHEALKASGYDYSEIDISKAIKNAYYANTDADRKGTGRPYIGLYYLTKERYEDILGENLPDKKTDEPTP